ncbi:MAG: hypothetical protein O2897_05495, partial [bacterium]|nr:hypothetical protein [bacterium]
NRTIETRVFLSENKTFAEETPVYILNPEKEIKQKESTEFFEQKALYWFQLGKISLQKKEGDLAARQLVKARSFALKTNNKAKNTFTIKIEQLLANAYYLKGFSLLEEKKYCKAKIEFINAQKLAPTDQKMLDRLGEIASLSRC